MFLWLWLAAPVTLFFFWTFKKKKKMMTLFAGNLLQEIASNFSYKRLVCKHALLVFVFIFSVFALARPQWGFQWQEIKWQGLDIIVLVDTSRSMLTQDVKPNRLERTKLAVKDLLKKLDGDRIGLIAFAGDAFFVSPMTIDYSGFTLSLNDLSTNTIPRGGTDISKAIHEAMRGYKKVSAKYKSIIIITDGENLEGDPLAAAEKAKEKGVKIYCIGIGTREGELIRVQNEQGKLEFLKDERGNFIKSRLNENILRRIAQITGGVYVRAGGAEFGLDVIYDQQLAKMEKRELESKMEKRYYERFRIPLVLSLLLLISETLLSTRKNLNLKSETRNEKQ